MPTGLQVTRAGQLAQDPGAKNGAIGCPMAPQMSQNGTRNPSQNPTIAIVVFWRGQIIPMGSPRRARDHQNNHNMKRTQRTHGLQMAPEGSRWLQKAPEGSRRLQKAPDGSRWLQKAPGGSRWLQKAPEGSRKPQMAQDGSRWLQMDKSNKCACHRSLRLRRTFKGTTFK